MKTFKYAIEGIFHAIKQERNMKIHLVLLGVASFMGFYFRISNMEWIIQLLLFAMVIGSEMFNTSIERITDGIYKSFDPNAKVIKDVAAGAVLFIAMTALAIGCIIYLPKFDFI
jgi:diacylglycerol kinase